MPAPKKRKKPDRRKVVDPGEGNYKRGSQSRTTRPRNLNPGMPGSVGTRDKARAWAATTGSGTPRGPLGKPKPQNKGMPGNVGMRGKAQAARNSRERVGTGHLPEKQGPRKLAPHGGVSGPYAGRGGRGKTGRYWPFTTESGAVMAPPPSDGGKKVVRPAPFHRGPKRPSKVHPPKPTPRRTKPKPTGTRTVPLRGKDGRFKSRKKK